MPAAPTARRAPARRALVAGGALLVVVALLVAGAVVLRDGEAALPAGGARAFLAAWSRADAETMDRLAVPPAGPAAPTAATTPAAVEPLRLFLRGVVTEGTGRAAAGVADLVGKTGTAEFGSGDPLPTHAWFVGQRNGIAFAVLLEGGGVGGRDAAPVAARFAGAI